MPSLSMSWLRSQPQQVFLLTPAQRAVRVLQVTRANWPVSAEGRRRARVAALVLHSDEEPND